MEISFQATPKQMGTLPLAPAHGPARCAVKSPGFMPGFFSPVGLVRHSIYNAGGTLHQRNECGTELVQDSRTFQLRIKNALSLTLMALRPAIVAALR